MRKLKSVTYEVRVEVEPPWTYSLADEDAQKQAAQRVADAIRRHVDGCGKPYLFADHEFVCEHCGSRWSEKSDTYNGGCCGKDEENAPKAEEIP